jgi:hypothetical protein
VPISAATPSSRQRIWHVEQGAGEHRGPVGDIFIHGEIQGEICDGEIYRDIYDDLFFPVASWCCGGHRSDKGPAAHGARSGEARSAPRRPPLHPLWCGSNTSTAASTTSAVASFPCWRAAEPRWLASGGAVPNMWAFFSFLFV